MRAADETIFQERIEKSISRKVEDDVDRNARRVKDRLCEEGKK